MKKAKTLIAIAVVLLMLVSGAVTVYAMDQGKAPAERQAIPADYAAEEMAVGAYYADWSPDMDGGLGQV